MDCGNANLDKLREMATSLNAEMARLNVACMTLKVDLNEDEVAVLFALYRIQAEEVSVGYFRFERYARVVA